MSNAYNIKRIRALIFLPLAEEPFKEMWITGKLTHHASGPDENPEFTHYAWEANQLIPEWMIARLHEGFIQVDRTIIPWNAVQRIELKEEEDCWVNQHGIPIPPPQS